MNEHLIRAVTNRPHRSDEARLVQPFSAPRRAVRLAITPGPEAWTGEWRPWTPNHAAEIHDLVHACSNRIGRKISRIAFAWNKTSVSHRHLMTPDDVILTRAEAGQPIGEMRMTSVGGVVLRLQVVPPSQRTTEPAGRRSSESAGRHSDASN